MAKRLGSVLALLLIAALLAACGGGGGDSGATTSQSSGGQVQRIEVSGIDFGFAPKEITVKKDIPVEIVFKNDGRVNHDLAIDTFNVRTPVITPGNTATITFTPNRTGEFKIVCTEPGHEASGMVGTIKVE